MTGNDIIQQVYSSASTVILALQQRNSVNHYGFYSGFNQWTEAAEIHLFPIFFSIDPELDSYTTVLQDTRQQILTDILKLTPLSDTSIIIAEVQSFISNFQIAVCKVQPCVLENEISFVPSGPVVD